MQMKIFTLVCALLLTSCSLTKIHEFSSFDETQVSSDQVTILHVPYWIKIHEIDGADKYYPAFVSNGFPYNGARISLLAGRHTVVASYSQPGYSYSEGTSTLAFTAVAGQEYFIIEQVFSKDGQQYVNYNIYACGSDKEVESNASVTRLIRTKTPACPARQE